MRQLLFYLSVLLLASGATRAADAQPAKVLIITGDDVPVHQWRLNAPFIKKLLTTAGHQVDITEAPSRDLTPENLARYDVFFLLYRDTAKGAKENPAGVWSDANKQAFLNAVKGGKGLYVHHYASGAFTGKSDFDSQFEKAVAGGWRKQGYHGQMHVFTVTVRKDHPITHGIQEFKHGRDELYQNSMILPGSVVLATAYSDKTKDPKNTGKDEPVVWVSQFGKGRVCENVLGHDIEAMQDPVFQALLVRGVEWTATGQASFPVPTAAKAK
jgi:type 1 glutamine amidotransferase